MRAHFILITAAITLAVLIVTSALVAFTASLHRATASLHASVESVRLIEEAETDLLLHIRTRDAATRRDIETALQRRLFEARRFAVSAHDLALLDAASRRVDEYVRDGALRTRSPAEATSRMETAYSALQAVILDNLEQSREEHRQATRWGELADMLGVVAGGAVILGAGWLLWWLKTRAFDPMLDIAAAMDRFGHGEREVRAEPRGLAELRDMANRFNEMASAISVQRNAQLAFLAGVAHDLRNPLQALRMSVALIPDDEPLPPEPRIRSVLAVVRRQLDGLERMTADFLDVARIESGKLDLECARHDARDIARKVVELCAATSLEHRLELELPRSDVPVYCDALRMEQVLMNLLTNAVKYSPRGSTIAVSLDREARDAVFRVHDEGPGISLAQQRTLFQPFQRSERSSQTPVPGTGIGLFVVKRIVDAHGGRVLVESEEGYGSTFGVYLPLAEHLDFQAPPASLS